MQITEEFLDKILKIKNLFDKYENASFNEKYALVSGLQFVDDDWINNNDIDWYIPKGLLYSDLLDNNENNNQEDIDYTDVVDNPDNYDQNININDFDVIDDENNIIETPKYNLYDILYINLKDQTIKVSPTIFSRNSGYFPIGICVLPTGFYEENSKARFMSLRHMSIENPENGTNTVEELSFDIEGINLTGITNYTTIVSDNEQFGGIKTSGKFSTDYDHIISGAELFNYLTEDNKFNNTGGALADFNGKEQTSLLHELAPNTEALNATINYHTYGTNAGDWYIGGLGEYIFVVLYKTNLNNIIQQLHTIYPEYCIDKLSESNGGHIYWASTVFKGKSPSYIHKIYGYSTINGYVNPIVLNYEEDNELIPNKNVLISLLQF